MAVDTLMGIQWLGSGLSMPVLDLESILSILLPTLTSIVLLAYWLGRRLAGIELNLRIIVTSLNKVAEMVAVLVGALLRSELLKAEELREIVTKALTMPSPSRSQANPRAEWPLKLKEYVERVRRGNILTLEEAEEFVKVSEDAKNQNLGDAALAEINVVAHFMRGLALALAPAKRQE